MAVKPPTIWFAQSDPFSTFFLLQAGQAVPIRPSLFPFLTFSPARNAFVGKVGRASRVDRQSVGICLILGDSTLPVPSRLSNLRHACPTLSTIADTFGTGGHFAHDFLINRQHNPNLEKT
jgi:hypothetical protein